MKYPGCGGACEQGDRPCDCGRELDPWDLERDHPWIFSLYVAAAIVAVLMTIAYPGL